MTLETLETAKKCIEEMGGHGSAFRYKNSITKKTLYAVFSLTQFIDIFDSSFCEEIKLVYDGTKWIL